MRAPSWLPPAEAHAQELRFPSERAAFLLTAASSPAERWGTDVIAALMGVARARLSAVPKPSRGRFDEGAYAGALRRAIDAAPGLSQEEARLAAALAPLCVEGLMRAPVSSPEWRAHSVHVLRVAAVARREGEAGHGAIAMPLLEGEPDDRPSLAELLRRPASRERADRLVAALERALAVVRGTSTAADGEPAAQAGLREALAERLGLLGRADAQRQQPVDAALGAFRTIARRPAQPFAGEPELLAAVRETGARGLASLPLADVHWPASAVVLAGVAAALRGQPPESA